MSVKKMNLSLKSELHAALFVEYKRLAVPATRLARRILEQGLRERRRARLEEEIQQFATSWAGTEVDLDPGLEEAATREVTLTCF